MKENKIFKRLKNYIGKEYIQSTLQSIINEFEDTSNIVLNKGGFSNTLHIKENYNSNTEYVFYINEINIIIDVDMI